MSRTRTRDYRLGWIPDVPDIRDIPFKTLFKIPTSLPEKTDIRSGCSAIEDQGALGSCTAQALVGALEFLQLRAIREGMDCEYADLSRLFVYYNTREAMGTVHEDSGAMLRTGIKELKRRGSCRESLWPYIISKFTRKPSPPCYEEAMQHQVTGYQRLSSLHEMKTCLAMGLPFVFGFAVYEHVTSDAVARSGRIRMPKPSERMLGGHAVMAVGYNDSNGHFAFRNSWGAGWGKSGYGELPYGYLDSRELSDDFWSIQSTESHCFIPRLPKPKRCKRFIKRSQ